MWIASGEHRGFFCSVIDVDEVAGRAVVRLRPSEADVAVRTRELVEEWEREAAEAERGRPRSSHREGSREREREHKKSRHREKERDRRRDREPGEERCGSASPCHAALRSATVTWTSIFDHHRGGVPAIPLLSFTGTETSVVWYIYAGGGRGAALRNLLLVRCGNKDLRGLVY